MSNRVAPQVTVITATYNCAATLRFALESLLLQDFTDFEAWIVGDACTDDSDEVVRSFGDARLQWMNLEKNTGSQSGPNNAGLKVARGRYVAYLGHDDLWMPWHLSGMVACIESTGADLAHSLSAVLDPSAFRQVFGPPRAGITYVRHFVPPSSWLHRRDLIDECGLWSDADRLARPVDHQYLGRVCRAGKAITFCPQMSVLKFPSASFRIYAHKGEPPQSAYLAAIRDDPVNVERQVLREVAATFAAYPIGGYEPPVVLFRRAFQYLKWDTIGRIAPDRWPVSAWRRRRFQQARRAQRARRGLPPRS